MKFNTCKSAESEKCRNMSNHLLSQITRWSCSRTKRTVCCESQCTSVSEYVSVHSFMLLVNVLNSFFHLILMCQEQLFSVSLLGKLTISLTQ